MQRHRLPRGRSGNARSRTNVNAALRDRVARLEAAVLHLQHDDSAVTPPQEEGSADFIASGFWDELMDAVMLAQFSV